MLKFFNFYFPRNKKFVKEVKNSRGGSFKLKKKLEPGPHVLLKIKNWQTLVHNSVFNFPKLSIKYEVWNLVATIYLSKNCS